MIGTDAPQRQRGEVRERLKRRTLTARVVSIRESAIAVRNPAWVVVGASLGLSLLGVHGISLTTGLDGSIFQGLALRQLVFVFIGLIAAAIVAVPSYRKTPMFTPFIAAGTVALLVFVLVPFVPSSIVAPRYGARRWINLGFTDFQPSEVAKVVYVLVLAGYLRYRSNHRRLTGLIPPALIALVPMSLILVEPDLGTSMVFIPALVAMLVAAGAKLSHLIATGSLGVVSAAAIVLVSLGAAGGASPSYPLLRPHQVERIQAVVDRATGDTRFDHDRGFQGKQAQTLVGAGGWFGHSADQSRALIHYSRVPEPHNDMISAVIGNRFGLLGLFAMVGLFMAWIGGALVVAGRCKDPFGRLVCVGFAAIVFTQMTVSIGMTVGLLPITGMTLPFVSYGGSSLVMGYVMVGVLMNIGMRRAPYLWQPSFEYDRAHVKDG